MSSSNGSISVTVGQATVAVIAVVAIGVGAIVAPSVTGGGSPACTTTYTAAGFDNSPFNGDAVNTAMQGAGSSAPVLCFASGTYAGVDLYNGSPTADVTLRPANGASVTMGGITVNHVDHVKITGFTSGSTLDSVAISNSAGNSSHIHVVGNAIVGGGSAVVNNTSTNADIDFTSNVFDGQDGSVTDLNRLKISGNTGCPSGITINANEMKNGSTDGVGVSGSCGVHVEFNFIHDIGTPYPGGCTANNGQHPHCDPIQCEGSCTDFEIDHNLIERADTCIVDYDGTSSGTNVHDNVCWDVNGVGSGTINLGNTSNPVVVHNTIGGTSGDSWGGGSGVQYINFGSKPGGQTTGVTVRNNITPNGVASNNGSGCTSACDATYTVSDYNMCDNSCTGAHSLTAKDFGTNYTFTGGTPPFGTGVFSSYTLAGGSSGINAASDGTNIGVNP